MTDFKTFKGEAKRLEDMDISSIAATIDVTEDELHAFMDTESHGSGYDREGRLAALYEPHVAYRNTSGTLRKKFVDAGLAYPKWGEKPYPKDSYDRIKKAYALNPEVALLATSWGLTQILGENFKDAGFITVQDMVATFMDDEETHLSATVNLIKHMGIDDDLRALSKLTRRTTPADCAPIVRVWNGPGYKRNEYDVKFASNHNKWRKIPNTPFNNPTPIPAVFNKPVDENTIRSVQLKLRELGYPEVGEADGKMGTKTSTGILAFRLDNKLALVPVINDELLSTLLKAAPRAIDPVRANATVAEVKEKSGTVAGLDGLKKAAAATVATAIAGGGSTIIDQLNTFKNITDILGTIAPWALLTIGGIAVAYMASRFIKARVLAYREGRAL